MLSHFNWSRTLVCEPPLRQAGEGDTRRRWALLLQQLFEVAPLACPTCCVTMRVVAFMSQASVIDQILTHLRTCAAPAAPAIDAGPRKPEPGTRPTPVRPRAACDLRTVDAPPPRGDRRRGPLSHRRDGWAPPAALPPR